MAHRRRYDTEALVGQLKAERRTGIMLTLGVLFIVAFLIVLYFVKFSDQDDIPIIPDDIGADNSVVADNDTSNQPANTAAGDVVPVAPTPAPPPQPTPAVGDASDTAAAQPAPAMVRIVVKGKAIVWLDGQKLGKRKKKNVQLQGGEHTIKARMGKKIVQKQVSFVDGGSYTIAVDGRKKRIIIKETTQ